MPADKYTRSLYKPGTVASEKAAIANRDPARKAAAEKIMKREGTTSPSGARPALLRVAPPSKPAKAPAVKMPKAPQIIRTTTNMKPTPMGKKR
jgi:hypothetical protein